MGTVSSESPKVQYSVQREQSDGSLNRISVRVPYFSKDDIHVYVDDVEINSSATEQSTYTWRWDGDYIAITPNVASGSEVLVRRITPINEAIHIFDGRSEFDDQSMDENFQQLIYIAQEYSEGSGIKDVFSDVNMHGYKIKNVGWATDDDDIVTYGQYKKDANGAHQAKEEAKDHANKAKTYMTTAQSSAGTAVSASNRSEAILELVTHLESETQAHAETAENAKNVSVQIKDELSTGLDNLQQISEPVRIVAANIGSVITDANSIDSINIVSSDLEGSLSDVIFDDYGDLGRPGDPVTSISGGNIKVVSDNIDAVRDNSSNMTHIVKVSTTIDQFPSMIESINGIKVQAQEARDLAKKWANHIGSPVESGEYSAKHYANEAKKNADKTSADLTAITQAKEQAIVDVNNAKTKAITAVNDAGSTQTVLVESEGDTQIQAVRDVGIEQTGAVEVAGTQQVNRVQAEADKQTKAVTTAGTTAVNTIKTEGGKQVELATAQATLATTKAKEAEDDAVQAHQSAVEASTSARNANSSATAAGESATQARGSETAARTSADNAALSKTAAELAAQKAQEAVSKVDAFSKAETTALLDKKLDKTVFDGFVDYGDLGNQ